MESRNFGAFPSVVIQANVRACAVRESASWTALRAIGARAARPAADAAPLSLYLVCNLMNCEGISIKPLLRLYLVATRAVFAGQN